MKLNVFKLALLELQRENKVIIKDGEYIFDKADFLERVLTIHDWINKHRIKTAQDILQGATIYRYGNKIKTYKEAI
jgi:hypothetical protein